MGYRFADVTGSMLDEIAIDEIAIDVDKVRMSESTDSKGYGPNKSTVDSD